jgi:hypothetical protein
MTKLTNYEQFREEQLRNPVVRGFYEQACAELRDASTNMPLPWWVRLRSRLRGHG